jgi:hypothetical protein
VIRKPFDTALLALEIGGVLDGFDILAALPHDSARVTGLT